MIPSFFDKKSTFSAKNATQTKITGARVTAVQGGHWDEVEKVYEDPEMGEGAGEGVRADTALVSQVFAFSCTPEQANHLSRNNENRYLVSLCSSLRTPFWRFEQKLRRISWGITFLNP